WPRSSWPRICGGTRRMRGSRGRARGSRTRPCYRARPIRCRTGSGNCSAWAGTRPTSPSSTEEASVLTTVPGVIDALLAALHGHPDRAGVTVMDGPPVRTLDYEDVIIVGFRGMPGEPGVTADRAEADLGGRTDRETYILWSMLSTTSGDTDLGPLRARAVA